MLPSIRTTISAFLLLALTAGLSSCGSAPADSTAQVAEVANSNVLLLSGQNNHDWTETHVFLQEIINEAGLFDLTTTLTPEKDAEASAWDTWNPDFTSYDAVVIDYNGEMWPDGIKKQFEDYISDGGTAYVVHAGNNPFPGWTAYEEMVGLLWRNEDTGTRVYMNEDGSLAKFPPGEDKGAGHGKVHDWQIQTRDANHPIMQGIPELWMHPHDELYHGQRGPAENMNILATAYSDPEVGGTGEHELMMWWIPYGQGKVLTFLAGHHWPKQEDASAFRCVGFRTMINRGLEWLTTGEVNSPVPANFPSADNASLLATQ